MHRTHLPLACAGLVALACGPSVPHSAAPASVTVAVFDVTSPVPAIPLPNDLALQPGSIAAFPDSAQKDLLTAFAAQGGFPNDQEVDITIDFQTQLIDPQTGAISYTAADLDLSTVTEDTVKIIELPGTAVPYAPITAASYVQGATSGELTIKNLGGAPWKAGARYAVAVRGGTNGVKTTDGTGISASPIFYLLVQGEDLSLPQNESLLPGDRATRAAEGAQLEQIRESYLTAFTLVSAYFPPSELAVLSTFGIAPAGAAYVQTDPNRGLIPLPSDFLLDATGSHVQNVPAFGPLAPGIATLDGFSTTGLILSTTSAPIQAATVNNATVFLYDLSDPSHPARVPDGTEAGGGYESEPAELTQTVAIVGEQVALSTAIGLQPAVPLASGAMLPPLKENTEYAVLISDGVKDLSGAGLSRSTLAQLLLFVPSHPVAANGVSTVSGVSDATATLIESIRQKLQPAIAQLANDKGIARSDLSMAYTFRTQSITGAGDFADVLAGVPPASQRPAGLLQLAALPYASAALSLGIISAPVVFHSYAAADAFAKYGVDTGVVPSSNIAEVIDAAVITAELLSPSTGAFDPALVSNPSITPIPALIVVPNEAQVPLCPAGLAPAGTHCAPLVIFHHGLGSDRTAMLLVADSLAARGFIVAAIDGDKHGDRSWCSADDQCAVGSTCVAIPGAAAQGDAAPPGTCSPGGPLKEPELCGSDACVTAWQTWTAEHPDDPADGHAAISGQYFISANLFRTRDSLRQDLIDQSALILALAPPPQLVAALPAGSTQAIATEIETSSAAANGGAPIVVDPRFIYWEGQSLGAILGTLNAAANSRISHVALNVGGGTIVDILTHAPAFESSIGELLSGIGIAPGTPPYLQFLILAKWILDPADPINAAGHLLGDAAHPMLPDLLTTAATGTVTLQTPKSVLGQMAACDDTVPNPFNLLLYGNIGILDLAKLESTAESNGNVSLFLDLAGSGNCIASANGIAPYAVPHAFLTTWGQGVDADPNTGAITFTRDANVAALTSLAQTQGAAFLADPNNLPPSQVAYPIP